MKRKIIVAVTGASGSIYAKILLQKLTLVKDQFAEIGVVFSANALDIWKYELDEEYTRISLLKFIKKMIFMLLLLLVRQSLIP